MKESAKISNKQAVFIMIMLIASTSLLLLPTLIYVKAEQDSWIAAAFGTVIGLIIIYFIIRLGTRFKDKSLLDYSKMLLGKPIGIFIGILYLLFFLWFDAIIIREFAEFIVSPFLPGTNDLFFMIVLMLASSYAVFMGLENIGRLSELIFPLFIIAILTVLLLGIPDMDIKNLAPVMHKGIMPVFSGAFQSALWLGESVFLLLVIPAVNKPGKTLKAGIIGIIVIGVLEIATLAGSVAFFGGITGNINYVLMTLARDLKAAGFLERFDPLILFFWIGGVFIKITMIHYCATLIAAQLFKVRDYRIMVVPTAVISTLYATFWWKNYLVEITKELQTYQPFIFLTVELFIPVILLTVAKMRKMGKKI